MHSSWPAPQFCFQLHHGRAVLELRVPHLSRRRRPCKHHSSLRETRELLPAPPCIYRQQPGFPARASAAQNVSRGEAGEPTSPRQYERVGPGRRRRFGESWDSPNPAHEAPCFGLGVMDSPRVCVPGWVPAVDAFSDVGCTQRVSLEPGPHCMARAPTVIIGTGRNEVLPALGINQRALAERGGSVVADFHQRPTGRVKSRHPTSASMSLTVKGLPSTWLRCLRSN